MMECGTSKHQVQTSLLSINITAFPSLMTTNRVAFSTKRLTTQLLFFQRQIVVIAPKRDTARKVAEKTGRPNRIIIRYGDAECTSCSISIDQETCPSCRALRLDDLPHLLPLICILRYGLTSDMCTQWLHSWVRQWRINHSRAILHALIKYRETPLIPSSPSFKPVHLTIVPALVGIFEHLQLQLLTQHNKPHQQPQWQD